MSPVTSVPERQRLTDLVIQHVLDRVSAGAFRAGDSLPSEAELARQLNVSKPVVREAISRLAALGLVQTQQGKATTIQGLTSAPLEAFFRLAVRATDSGLREAIELRRGLETEIAALAATRANRFNIEQMATSIDRMRDNIDGNFDKWLQGDMGFHLALARGSGNALFEHLIEALSDIMRFTMTALGTQRDLRDPAATVRRHEAVLEAVKAGDPARARVAMIEHFAVTENVIEEISRDHRRMERLPR
ncbi:FadR/GntR family transcriptional regulator [Acuticoccus kandeliae]|uniref:FadR/GntR family transcriptional regulator n=1 Tax=Acuticoccus kandeliae TaxID=2073160 RepID=UPI000D3E130A|nr:FadR/GntR family transcriptional regulator [Acuticoccus kandeliae]